MPHTNVGLFRLGGVPFAIFTKMKKRNTNFSVQLSAVSALAVAICHSDHKNMNCKHFAVHINEIVFIAACLEFVHFENYRFICQLLSKICGICITTLYGSIFLGYLG